jgi:Taurine catabolism dioxygenase TauD, TfdA family
MSDEEREALRNSAQTLKKALVCDEEPPLGSILYLHTVPPVGGDTLFASQYAALSPRMKTYLKDSRLRIRANTSIVRPMCWWAVTIAARSFRRHRMCLVGWFAISC